MWKPNSQNIYDGCRGNHISNIQTLIEFKTAFTQLLSKYVEALAAFGKRMTN